MARLNKEREKELTPKRLNNAIQELTKLGIENIAESEKGDCLIFIYKEHAVKFFPYSGWHTGKSIKDGRGLRSLIQQLK